MDRAIARDRHADLLAWCRHDLSGRRHRHEVHLESGADASRARTSYSSTSRLNSPILRAPRRRCSKPRSRSSYGTRPRLPAGLPWRSRGRRFPPRCRAARGRAARRVGAALKVDFRDDAGDLGGHVDAVRGDQRADRRQLLDPFFRARRLRCHRRWRWYLRRQDRLDHVGLEREVEPRKPPEEKARDNAGDDEASGHWGAWGWGAVGGGSQQMWSQPTSPTSGSANWQRFVWPPCIAI